MVSSGDPNIKSSLHAVYMEVVSLKTNYQSINDIQVNEHSAHQQGDPIQPLRDT